MDDFTSVLEEQKEKRRREMVMRNLKGMNEFRENGREIKDSRLSFFLTKKKQKVKTHFQEANFTHKLATFQVISSLTRNFLKGARSLFRKNYLLKIGRRKKHLHIEIILNAVFILITSRSFL